MKFNELWIEYNKLVAINCHTEAAQLLTDTFGKEEEKIELERIAIRQKKWGMITNEDSKKRQEISQKYYKLLRNLV